MSKILAASKFAAEIHKGVTRKVTGDPYIFHPGRVAGYATCILQKYGLPHFEDIIAACWGHDIIEDRSKSVYSDAGIIYALVSAGFSDYSIGLIRELTNPSKDSNESRDIRMKMNRDHLATVSCEAKLIKLIDRMDNVIEMPGDDFFFSRYYHETKLLVKAIVDSNPSSYGSDILYLAGRINDIIISKPVIKS